MTQTLQLSQQRKKWLILTLLFLSPLVGMAVDLIAPSLPAIASGLGASNKLTKDIISIYLLGYALGNFFIGFLTDALGRQKLMRIALIGVVIASIIPIFSSTIQMLLLSRLLQGMMLGSVAVLCRAIYTDILSSTEIVRFSAIMAAMWGLGPVIGPIIGGYLQHYFGWQSNFVFFASLSFLELIIIYFILPETHFNRHSLNIYTIKSNFIKVISCRIFLGMSLLMGFSYSFMIIFNTAAPFLIQNKLHYSAIFYGHMAFILGLIFLISTIFCRHLQKTYNLNILFLFVINISFMVTILAVILSYFYFESIYLIMFISILIFFATGFIFPMSMGKGLSMFRGISGTASAIMFLINVLITSVASFFTSFISVNTAIPLMWMYFILILLSTLVYWIIKYPLDQSEYN